MGKREELESTPMLLVGPQSKAFTSGEESREADVGRERMSLAWDLHGTSKWKYLVRSFLEIKVQCPSDTSKPVGRVKAGRERRGRERGRTEGRKVGWKGDGPVPAHHTLFMSLLEPPPRSL